MSALDLRARIVLLTGAAGHLGRAMSRAILAAGADLVLVGRQEETLLALRDGVLGDFRDRCHVVACDVTRLESAELLRSEIKSRFGRLHGIVNNAYSGKAGSLDRIEAADFLRACAYNLVAPFSLVQTFTPLLRAAVERDGGTASVVNVASMYGKVSPDPAVYEDPDRANPAHYGASKAGMIQLSRHLACHLGPIGIRVNSLSPGPFPASDAGLRGFHDRLARKVPLGRLGRPEEIGGPVVFLLSEASSYVNGADLAVDGGWTAW